MKKTLFIFGAAFAGLAFLGVKKYKQAQELLRNLQVEISSISDLKINSKNISLNAVLKLQNNTNVDFGATLTSLIKVKTVKVYNVDGLYLGQAEVNISSISIPNNSFTNLPEIPFEFSLGNAGAEFFNNITNYLNKDFSRLKFKLEIEAFGSVITIKA